MKIPEIPSELYANIGKVLANWNVCEHGMCRLIEELVKGPNNAGAKIAALLGNDSRADLLRHCSTSLEVGLSKTILEYLANYSICLENRNLIAHASYYPDLFDIGPFLQKRPKGQIKKLSTYQISVESIQQVAIDCENLDRFGWGIIFFIHFQDEGNHDGWVLSEREKRPTLPQIPERPRKMAPFVEPDQRTQPPPPQSSQE